MDDLDPHARLDRLQYLANHRAAPASPHRRKPSDTMHFSRLKTRTSDYSGSATEVYACFPIRDAGFLVVYRAFILSTHITYCTLTGKLIWTRCYSSCTISNVRRLCRKYPRLMVCNTPRSFSPPEDISLCTPKVPLTRFGPFGTACPL